MDLICIPSAGRAKRQQTLSFLEKSKIIENYQVILVVPEDELARYRMPSFKGKPIKRNTMNSIILEPTPSDVSGISATREYILTDLARQHKAEHVLMLDDDLLFCHRPDIDKETMPYISVDPMGMHTMVETLTMWLEQGLVHVGLISRQANRQVGIEYQEPGRMMNAYAYNARIIRQLINKGLIEFGRVRVMEDFDLTLQLLKLGYPSRVSCQFAWTQVSNIDGGCSTYRTAEVQREAALKLAKLHAPFVKTVEKQAKTWKGGLTARTDVRVQWLKAYQHGLTLKKTLDKIRKVAA